MRIQYQILLMIGLVLPTCKSSDNTANPCINQGNFDAILTETGELQAVRAKSVVMPYIGGMYGYQFKITGMLEHGSHVRAGDSIIQIDASNVLKYQLEQENMLEVEKANLNKLLVEQKSKLEEMEARLAESLADFNLKKLELERFEFESERKKGIKQLEFQQAGINLDRVKKAKELEKKICENNFKIQRIKVSRIESNIANSRIAMNNLTVRSPIDGVLQIDKSWRTGQLLKVGDEIYQNQRIALVPDLDEMKVKSTVNETDIGKISTGQRVVVRLEAFPEQPFDGKIAEIGRLSYNKEWESIIKIFDLEIVLNDADPVLKPGMTVSCDIYYAELEDVYYVENSCLQRENGNYYLYMKDNNTWRKSKVRIGPRNNQYTVLYGEYRKGTELMLPEQAILAEIQ